MRKRRADLGASVTARLLNRKPLRLSDLRKPLRDKPVDTEVLKGLFERDLEVKPLEQRIVATIIGVSPSNVPIT
jgi:hypothetical protein